MSPLTIGLGVRSGSIPSAHHATGLAAPDRNTLTYDGQEPEPTGGPAETYRDEIAFISDDEYTMRRFYLTPEGDLPGFSITFTRE